MKIFGSLSELVSLIFRKNSQTITLRPNSTTTYTAARTVDFPAQDASSILVSRTSTDTLTNKTLTSPAITTPTGLVKGDVGLGNVDNTSDATKNSATATLTNKTIDGDNNTVQNLPETAIKTNLTNASKFFTRNASGVPESATKAVPTGAVVGTTDSQTLTNKTLTSPAISTPSGLTKADVGLGNVDNTSDATKLTASATLQNKAIDNTNSITVKDNVFTIQDDADTSKQAKFQASGIATSTTRTLTIPDATTTLVGTDAAQVLTNKDIDGGTASNSKRITLPADTTTNINALTRKKATLLYDTSTDQIKYDNGTTLTALSASSIATPTAQGTTTSYFPTIQSAVKTVSSANYTVLTTDGYSTIEVTTGASDRTITLPAVASNTGRVITITKVDSGAGHIILATNGGTETINGATSNTLYQQNSRITLTGGSSEWKVTAVNDYLESVQTVSGAPGLTANVIKSIVSLVPLTPGEWDISAIGGVAAGTNGTYINVGISTTINSFTGSSEGNNKISIGGPINAAVNDYNVSIAPWRVTITSNTNYYLSFQSDVTTTSVAFGRISARRVG